MLSYILFIVLVAFFLYQSNFRDRTRYRAYFACFLIVFIAAFRFDVGFDYSNYYDLIESLDVAELAVFSLWEPAHLILIYICKYFDCTALYMILISLFTTISILYAIYNYNKKTEWFIGVLIYLSLYYLHGFSTMRQAAAVAVILLSYPFIRDGKFLKFLMMQALALLFHYSSICVLPIYFIYNYVNNKNQLLYYALIVVGGSFMHLLSNTRYAVYLGNEDLGGGDKTKYLYIIIILIHYLLYKKCHCNTPQMKFFYVFLLGCLFPFMFGGHIGARLQEYYFCFAFFVFPQIIVRCGAQMKKIAYCMFALLFVFQVYNSHINAVFAGKDQYIPYRTIFNANLRNPHFK